MLTLTKDTSWWKNHWCLKNLHWNLAARVTYRCKCTCTIDRYTFEGLGVCYIVIISPYKEVSESSLLKQSHQTWTDKIYKHSVDMFFTSTATAASLCAFVTKYPDRLARLIMIVTYDMYSICATDTDKYVYKDNWHTFQTMMLLFHSNCLPFCMELL